MEKKFFRLHDVKADSAARTIEGWASTFGNKDSDDDIILPGAFTASIKSRMPKMLWQHDSSQVIGIWDDAKETEQGLFVRGHILPTSLGNDAYELAKAGAIDSMSIGYVATKSTTDDQTWTRTIEEIDLWEVSLVTFPANDRARITSVKSAPDNERDLELLLRDAGYPREAAKTIVARGFKALNAQRDADEQTLTHLTDLFKQFKS